MPLQSQPRAHVCTRTPSVGWRGLSAFSIALLALLHTLLHSRIRSRSYISVYLPSYIPFLYRATIEFCVGVKRSPWLSEAIHLVIESFNCVIILLFLPCFHHDAVRFLPREIHSSF